MFAVGGQLTFALFPQRDVCNMAQGERVKIDSLDRSRNPFDALGLLNPFALTTPLQLHHTHCTTRKVL